MNFAPNRKDFSKLSRNLFRESKLIFAELNFGNFRFWQKKVNKVQKTREYAGHQRFVQDCQRNPKRFELSSMPRSREAREKAVVPVLELSRHLPGMSRRKVSLWRTDFQGIRQERRKTFEHRKFEV